VAAPEAAQPFRQDAQRLLFRAITGLVEAMAGVAPLALLLDDLHWADGASLKLLLHLVRHSRSARVLLLGTYRDTELGREHPLTQALLDLGREGLAERMAVGRLPEEGTAALIASNLGEAEVSGEFAELVHRRTEGNPFFVKQVLRALVERGDLYREDDRWQRREIEGIEVPESIRSAIGQRIARLSREAQEVLGEASILGQSFRFDDLQVLAARGEVEIEEALEEASEARLLQESGRDAYRFDHALTQQALSAALSGRKRRRLHLAAGQALEQLPEHGAREESGGAGGAFPRGRESRAGAEVVAPGRGSGRSGVCSCRG
jgi:predicted ATPase